MRLPAIMVLAAVSVSLAFAPDGCIEGPVMSHSMVPATDASITITLEDEWLVDWASQVLGMDAWNDGSYVNIVFSSRNDMQLSSLDPSTGGSAGAVDLDPANTNCFGVVWNDDLSNPVWHTNDWTDNVLYYTEDQFTTWETTANPAEDDGRGMDFDGTDYWQSYKDEGVYRFQPGTGQELISISGLPGQISGLSVFPYEGNMGLVVTFYQTNAFYFYEWDGASMTMLGEAPTPFSVYRNYGLAYCEFNEMLYWAYQTSGGDRYIAELSFTIEEALQPTTWGQIKAGL